MAAGHRRLELHEGVSLSVFVCHCLSLSVIVCLFVCLSVCLSVYLPLSAIV